MWYYLINTNSLLNILEEDQKWNLGGIVKLGRCWNNTTVTVESHPRIIWQLNKLMIAIILIEILLNYLRLKVGHLHYLIWFWLIINRPKLVKIIILFNDRRMELITTWWMNVVHPMTKCMHFNRRLKCQFSHQYKQFI